MTTNIQGTRPVARQDEPVRVEPSSKPTPVVSSSGVSGVAVYDRGPDVATNSSINSEVSMTQDPAPISGQSTSSFIVWIIGLIVLIVLVFFLWQIFF